MNSPPTSSGEVVGVFIAATEGSPVTTQEQVRAIAGQGLEGDRYFDPEGGAFDKADGPSEITLIESEAVDAVNRDHDIKFDLGDSRRNIVTRGVALNHLVDRRFRVGDALLSGIRLCEPCEYLEGLTQKGVRKALIHRGGLRARIVESGTIRVGDPVRVEA